jgi:hypothetical protein
MYIDREFQIKASKAAQSRRIVIESNGNLEKTEKFSEMLSGKHFKDTFSEDIFIPAGRSFFSLLRKNIFRFLQTSNNIDPFLVAFGIFYEETKQTECDIPTEARELIHSILKGDYMYWENLLFTGSGKVALELLSSGKQEALPLALAHLFSLRLESYTFINIYTALGMETSLSGRYKNIGE